MPFPMLWGLIPFVCPVGGLVGSRSGKWEFWFLLGHLLGGPLMAEDRPESKRLGSLDALRGFVMFLLLAGGEIGCGYILGTGLKAIDSSLTRPSDKSVSEGARHDPSLSKREGSIWSRLYDQLQYSKWGAEASVTELHVKDLVRPMFIFVVGVAMPYSFGKRLSLGESKWRLYGHILQRAVILFFLGTIAGGHLLAFDRSKFFLVNNVLQEIGVGYLVASVILLNFSVRGQVAVTAALLLVYWALVMLVPVPGHEAGILAPDLNFPRYVDDLVLGKLRPTWPFTWTLSLPLASSCITMLGVLAGELLKSNKSPWGKLGWMVGVSLGCLVASLVWGQWYPIIVSLTTGSWVLFVGAVGFGMLALFYLVVDLWGWRKWAFPLVVIGSNSIAVYMAAHLFDFRHIGDVFVGGLANWIGPGPWNDCLRASAAFMVIWLILYWMYRTKSFVKV